jgi:hypothetical protein
MRHELQHLAQQLRLLLQQWNLGPLLLLPLLLLLLLLLWFCQHPRAILPLLLPP